MILPPAPLDDSIGGCFARVVARHPHKVAIDSAGGQIRFADLDSIAKTIALRLLAATARPAGQVGLLFDNPILAIGTMLGVLQAGHAYVTLDPGDPEDRTRFILSDCEPFVLLTDDAHFDFAQRVAPASCKVLSVTFIRVTSVGVALPAVPMDATAYLFYTSGSTGRPKGVGQTHRNLRHFVGRYIESLRITEADRLSQLFSLSFSAANLHLYGGLLTGATICPYDTRQRGVVPLADWLDAQRVSVVHTVPTIFRRLAQGLDPRRVFPHIRALDVGGEMLFAADVVQFRRCLPAGAQLVHHLGATEANVIAQKVIERETVFDESGAVPVGRSPEGVEVTIRRPDGSKAAADEVGEVFISSPYLSPGYWRRPELNGTVFADDPDRPGWRIFRSGDVGRVTPERELVFLGRSGTRVKLRGQSVDLHEEEAGLRQCQGVIDAAVIALAGPGLEETAGLAAYVVAGPTTERDSRKFRRELSAHLPKYMLPSAFSFVAELPQTATGKLDRLALAQWEAPQSGHGESFEPPRDDVEARIAAVFEKILKVAPVGRGDDFFLVGGDSLLAGELHVHLVNLFGSGVPGVFEDTTVAGMAEQIRHVVAEPAGDRRLMPVLLPRRSKGEPPILFLVHGRRGQAHTGARFLELIGGEQPLYVFQARGVDGIQPPHETLDAMAADYVAALMEVQPHGPYFIGGMCSGGFVALKMAHLLRSLGAPVGPLLLIDPPVPPFTEEDAAKNLSTLGPGLRALQQKGNIDFDFNDPKRTKGAIQVAMSLEKALVLDRAVPYDGPVYLLSSREKLTPDGWRNPEKLRAHFSGPVECFEVGERHVEILDTNNADFARHLAQCVKRARAAIQNLR